MPETVFAVLVATVGGLTGFGLLVLLGQILVRRLGLLGDPPDELAFAPPPPPPTDPDRARAAATAETQSRLLAWHRLAYEAYRRQDECRAVLGLATAGERQRWQELAERCAQEAGRCRDLLGDLPGSDARLADAHDRAVAAADELRDLVGERGRPSLGRRLLLAFLILLLLASLAIAIHLVYGLGPS